MASSQIISQMRRKKADGSYDVFYLGPEQRYSSALPTSNDNNLEEQLLFGVDRVIRAWHDDVNNVERRTVEFRRAGDTVGYYVLEIYQYQNSIDTSDIYVTGDNLTFSSNMNVVDEVLVQDYYDKRIKYDDDTLVIQLTSVVERDILNYVQEDGSVTPVSEKVITREPDGDAVIIKEVITNYL